MLTRDFERLTRKVPALMAVFRLAVLRKAQACRKKAPAEVVADVSAKVDAAKKAYMEAKLALKAELKARKKAARKKADPSTEAKV